MRVYQLTIRVIDHDDVGAEGIKSVIENARYPNRCIRPEVASVLVRDIGEWSDDHPLNRRSTAEAEWGRLFSESQ